MKAEELVSGVVFRYKAPERDRHTLFEYRESADGILCTLRVIEDQYPNQKGDEMLCNKLDKGIELYDWFGSIRLSSEIIKYSRLELVTKEACTAKDLGLR